jgi:hypothetical protein
MDDVLAAQSRFAYDWMASFMRLANESESRVERSNLKRVE